MIVETCDNCVDGPACECDQDDCCHHPDQFIPNHWQYNGEIDEPPS